MMGLESQRILLMLKMYGKNTWQYVVPFSSKKTSSNPLQKNPRAQPYEKGWIHYEDVKSLIPSLAKGKFAYQANGLGVEKMTITTHSHISGNETTGNETTDNPHPEESMTTTPNNTSPTSLPSHSSFASNKRPFSVLESGSLVEDINDISSIKSLSPFTPSGSSPSSSTISKRGRMTGASGMHSIGHSLMDIGVSYRKGLESKEIRHQERMGHLDRELEFQREREQRQQHQELQRKRQEAMTRAQLLDSDIGPDNLAALLEVFETEEVSVTTYLSIITDETRKAWVRRKIAKVSAL
jgi:hypothetical protein